MKNYAFLFWAYLVIWLGIAGYLLFFMSRMGKVQRRVENLEREIARSAADPGHESRDS